VQEASIVRLQAVFRGFMVRKKLKEAALGDADLSNYDEGDTEELR